MPRTREVAVRRYAGEGLDRYRNTVTKYVDDVATIYSIAPRSSVEQVDGALVAVVSGAELYAPEGFNLGPKDLVIDERGRAWALEGEVADWAGKSPLGVGMTRGGVVVNLTRSTS